VYPPDDQATLLFSLLVELVAFFEKLDVFEQRA
jgi:hypothetical protein